MKEDKLLNDLFESARTEEPKRSYEEVADSFTKTVPPTGIAETVRELLFNNISLNSILVVITGGALLTAALMFSSPSEAVNNDEIFSQIIPQEENVIAKTEEPIITEIKEDVQPKQNTANTSSQISPKKETPQKTPNNKITVEVSKPIVPTKDIVPTSSGVNIESDLPTPQKTPSQEVVITEPNNKITPTINPESKPTQAPSNPPKADAPVSNTINATNGYNELFTGYGTNLKRLKRNLLGKLVSDGFIDSKKDEVVIKIEEKQVVINGIKLKPYYYTKYTSIAQDYEIVPDDNRQIRIDDDMILVGDFTEAGFKGKGEGYGDFFYFPNFQAEVKLGSTPIDINPTKVPKRKSQISWDESIMQQILDTDQFEVIFRKDNRGNFIPLTILTNNHFSANIDLEYKGVPIKLIHGEASLSANSGLPIIYMDKYKFGKKKGTIKFLYDGYEISVQLKRFNNDWLRSRLQVKGKKENRIDVKF